MWVFAPGCVIVRAMDMRRWVRAARGRVCIVVVGLSLGCSDDGRRFVTEDVARTTDLGGNRDGSMDAGLDGGDMDAAIDGGRDVSDVYSDATSRTDTGLRDVTIESSVLGCSANSDCPSPDLYCNGAGCATRGFCTPRRTAGSCPMVDAGSSEMVCGCDGMTYGSVCQLQVEGVRLQGFGLCPRD